MAEEPNVGKENLKRCEGLLLVASIMYALGAALMLIMCLALAGTIAEIPEIADTFGMLVAGVIGYALFTYFTVKWMKELRFARDNDSCRASALAALAKEMKWAMIIFAVLFFVFFVVMSLIQLVLLCIARSQLKQSENA